ncbi:MAG: hypothetical protein ACLFPU_01260 [Dehalococcoidia bacterium]
MDFPPEIAVRAVLKRGAVFYFEEETLSSSEPHYFIVINTDPKTDEILLLVCCSSRTNKVKRRNCPEETLVEISPEEYPDFRTGSIVNCNNVWEKKTSELVGKYSQGKLKLKDTMSAELVDKLQAAVIASSVVERRIQAMLNPPSNP